MKQVKEKAAGGNQTAKSSKHYKPKRFNDLKQLSFEEVNAAAKPVLLSLLQRWLPKGVLRGHEYYALNPNRLDRHIGSFSVNVVTGRWADFASGDYGGDVISLAAYLSHRSQYDAALELAKMLGVSHEK